MKHLALLSLSATLLAVGCTGNDKTSAGLEGNPNAPPSLPRLGRDSESGRRLDVRPVGLP